MPKDKVRESRDRNAAAGTTEHKDRPGEAKARREAKATEAEKAKATAAAAKEQGKPQPLPLNKAVEFIAHGLKKLATVCFDAGNAFAGIVKNIESAPEREAERAAAFGLYQIGDEAMKTASLFKGEARLEEYQKVWAEHMPKLQLKLQQVETDAKGNKKLTDRYEWESPRQWREVVEAALVSVVGEDTPLDPAIIRTTEMAFQRAAKAYQTSHPTLVMPKLGNRAQARRSAGETEAGVYFMKPGAQAVKVKADNKDHVSTWLKSLGSTDNAIAFVVAFAKYHLSIEAREALVEAIESISADEAAGEKAA